MKRIPLLPGPLGVLLLTALFVLAEAAPAGAVVIQINGTTVPITSSSLQLGLNVGEGNPTPNPLQMVEDAATTPELFTVPTDETGTFGPVRFVFLQHYAGCVNRFGWYNADTPSVTHQVFLGSEAGSNVTQPMPAVATWQDGCGGASYCKMLDFETLCGARDVSGDCTGTYKGGAVGFYLLTSGDACGGRYYYTQSDLNADGNYVHYLVYASLVDLDSEGRPLAYYFAFEDLFRGGDNDFADSVFKVEGLTQPCTPSSEICDGEDNDCNGIIDDVDYGDEACAPPEYPVGWDPSAIPSSSVCTGGEYACEETSAGVFETVCNNAPLPELGDECDGLDNDCDGLIDEDFDPASYSLGAICDSGMTLGLCTAQLICDNGTVVCSELDGPQTEICDGLDNNCDGQVDEDGGVVDEGVACACSGDVDVDLDTMTVTLLPSGACDGVTGGACGIGATVCTAGTLACEGWLAPGIEVCNGVDDDCDGEIDEGSTDVGPSTTCTPSLPPGTSLCSDGSYSCVNGVKICTGFTLGSPELCDGLDNDCDGTPDDSPIDIGQACGSSVGACSQGTYICASGGRVCDGAVTPAPETCDGVDNDCDGVVDEGATGGSLGDACTLPGVPACAGTVGCVAGSEQCVVPSGSPEICDGIDNDCDGVVDDNPAGVGEQCGTSVGACERGDFVCTAGALVCSGGTNATAELCNGIDDDCDGQVDDGPYAGGNVGAACNLPGSPQCTGTLICLNGSEQCAVDAGSPELCNGIDDDCDGEIDETPTNIGGICSTTITAERGNTGACEFGRWICAPTTPGDLTTDVRTCAGEIGPTTELCDGVDNDCDGLIDNDYDGTNPAFVVRGDFAGQLVAVGAACDQGDCVGGAYACVNGAMFCQTDSAGTVEYCDGIDNNCNGEIDEPDALVDVGSSCQTLAVVCSAGTWTCDSGELVCDGQIPGTEEICDGIDNDCNGLVDDGALGGIIATSCALPGAPQCSGAWTCIDGQTECAVDSQSPELCDGIDNDCDGIVDNSPTDVDLPCSSDLTASTGSTGACEYGQWDCVASTSGDPTTNRRICAGEVGPSEERCDGIDNDCDGFVDNDSDGDAGDFLLIGQYDGQDVAEGEDCTVVDADGELAPGCLSGAFTCRAGMMQCDMLVAVTAERCDGVDNNCDGRIDEPDALVDVGTACTTYPYVCAAGVWSCENGELLCEGEDLGTQEECDGIDNDCDGIVDNPPSGGFVGEGEICMPEGITSIPNPDTSMCQAGELRCHNGALGCIGAIGPWAEEICDGIDNDCDGQTDTFATCPGDTLCTEGECRLPCGSGEFPCPGGFSCQSDGFCQAFGSGTGGTGSETGGTGGTGSGTGSATGTGSTGAGLAGSNSNYAGQAGASESTGATNGASLGGSGNSSSGSTTGANSSAGNDTNGDGKRDDWALTSGGGGCSITAPGRGSAAGLALLLLSLLGMARRTNLRDGRKGAR